jgi:predicted dehydrogenase/threonine dehydrogenase-like Zn-dependent dehydrogenase
MKHILQDLKTGDTQLAEIPCPRVQAGSLLIRTRASVISAGTERTLLAFGKANLLEKARQQPDKVRQVLDKVCTDGLLPTLEAVRAKLEQPLSLGYCNAGVVLEVGANVQGFAPGDRVVSNGPHAEVVRIPQNLCARIPPGVSDESAALTVLGAIALQGIRLVQPTLGESMVVIGLGLIGLLAVQLLRAHGCRVLGIDFEPSRLALASAFGAETVHLAAGGDPIAADLAFSHGRGVDGVLITASTQGNEPVHQAAQMCRKRGRIVLIGVTGLALSRADFYEKELSFQVSCSYGPGRYDTAYEEEGHDYPLGFVRWTAQRNFEAVLDMLADGRLDVTSLISHRFPLAQAVEAYKLLGEGTTSLRIILQYPEPPEPTIRQETIVLPRRSQTAQGMSHAVPVIGIIGAGNYATHVLLPALQGTQAHLKSIASSGGVSAAQAGRKFGFETTTTDTSSLFTDNTIDTLMIATRHDSHALLVCRALEAGKHVFVEKPLALTSKELGHIVKTYQAVSAQHSPPLLMVGFNRRFAPQVQKMKALLDRVQAPKSFIMTVNAGEVPSHHWTQDAQVGGGRIIGEGCHFIDLLRFLAGCPITGVQGTMLDAAARMSVREDKMSFILTFADGSFGTVHYLANGHRSFPKERLEVFCAGRVLQLDNFRMLRGYGWPGFKKMRLWRQDKGHKAEIAAFVQAVRQGGPAPIPFEELVEVTRVSFEVIESAKPSIFPIQHAH